MNVDEILLAMNQSDCQYLLIGGMNFMLRHQPILTYDVDLWIEDTAENRGHCEQALIDLDAQWGATDQTWGSVANLAPGWLDSQQVFCLTTAHGAVDIFRQVSGLSDWHIARSKSSTQTTGAGILYHSLSDEDMLKCQEALPQGLQKADRMRILREAIGKQSP